jgi:hypothetical protein
MDANSGQYALIIVGFLFIYLHFLNCKDYIPLHESMSKDMAVTYSMPLDLPGEIMENIELLSE